MIPCMISRTKGTCSFSALGFKNGYQKAPVHNPFLVQATCCKALHTNWPLVSFVKFPMHENIAQKLAMESVLLGLKGIVVA